MTLACSNSLQTRVYLEGHCIDCGALTEAVVIYEGQPAYICTRCGYERRQICTTLSIVQTSGLPAFPAAPVNELRALKSE